MTEGFASPRETVSPRFAIYPSSTPQTRWLVRRFLAWGLLLFLLAAMLQAGSACAAELDLSSSTVTPKGPLGYDACARLAIKQSPYLTKSSVEINVRRMDETDSRYSMLPTFTFHSTYYINQPSQEFGLNPKPYVLSFTTNPYNPFGAYFTLQAQKKVTQIAVLSHLQIISEGLVRLGQMFLNLAASKQQAVTQGNLVTLAQESLTYAEKRQSIGTGTFLEVQMATQELELAKSELEQLEGNRKNTLASLKSFLGLRPDAAVEFDLRDTRRQVLGRFDPAAATLEQAEKRSYELKALKIKKEVQGYNIMLAKTRVLPSLTFAAQSPDPLSATTARGIYVGVGLEVPIWDGFKRIRDISRQKAILNEFGTDLDLKKISLTNKWNSLQVELKGAATAVKIAQSQEKLGLLKERQAEIRYHSGSEPLPLWLEARKAEIEAKKAITDKTLKYDILVLSLRQLSGDLGYSYVDPKSWQN